MNRRRLLTGTGLVVAIAAVWWLVRSPLAAAIADGLRLPLLSTTVDTFGADPLRLVDRGFAMTLLLIAIGVVLLSLYSRRPRELLAAPGEALDLAVVRVVIFGVLALLPRVREAIAVAALPADLRRPPAGVPWLLDAIPPTPQLVRVAAGLFVLACLCACVGLFTRPAAVTAVSLGIYVLGVPQFYGKVSHYHHLLWIAAVLAAAPAGAALSVDAVRRALRTGDLRAGKPPAAVAFGLPLRLIWLIIAATYLFPGLWKFASAGWAWAFSDNVRTVMYEHWTRLDGFTPILPVDQWPVAYQLGGLFTLVFELTFLFWLWAPRPRLVAAATGLAFHNLNYLFLRLSFATLQVCYVAFVPWQRVAHWVGRRLPATTTDVSGRSGRLPAALAAVDPFDRLHVTGYVPPGAPVHADPPHPASPRAAAVVGAIVLAGVTTTGIAGVTAAWPFACYPTFAGIAELSPEILLVVTGADGQTTTLPARELRQFVSWEKLDGLTRPILQGEGDPVERTRALLTAVEDAGMDLPDAGTVEVYRSQPAWSGGDVITAGQSKLFEFDRT